MVPTGLPAVITAMGQIILRAPRRPIHTPNRLWLLAPLCFRIPFKISALLDSPPATFRLYRINPILVKQADAVLDRIPGRWPRPPVHFSVLQPDGLW